MLREPEERVGDALKSRFRRKLPSERAMRLWRETAGFGFGALKTVVIDGGYRVASRLGQGPGEFDVGGFRGVAVIALLAFHFANEHAVTKDSETLESALEVDARIPRQAGLTGGGVDAEVVRRGRRRVVDDRAGANEFLPF